METIAGIAQVEHVKQNTLGVGGGLANLIGALSSYGEYDGYRVDTDKQSIYVLIDNEQSCCESWGYLSSDDDLSRYVGAGLRNLAITDEGLNTRMVDAGKEAKSDSGGIVFVTFDTTVGPFQLACYNGHNGYYGHEVHIISEQLTEVIGV